MTGFLQRLLGRIVPHPGPMPARAADVVGRHLRDVVAAGARAKTDNSRTYEARVQCMMDDFFLKMRDIDARPRP